MLIFLIYNLLLATQFLLVYKYFRIIIYYIIKINIKTYLSTPLPHNTFIHTRHNTHTAHQFPHIKKTISNTKSEAHLEKKRKKEKNPQQSTRTHTDRKIPLR